VRLASDLDMRLECKRVVTVRLSMPCQHLFYNGMGMSAAGMGMKAAELSSEDEKLLFSLAPAPEHVRKLPWTERMEALYGRR